MADTLGNVESEQTETSYNCRRCGYYGRTRELLLKHLRKDPSCRPIVEDIPIETLRKEASIRLKNVYVNENGQRVYMCSHCGKGYSTSGSRGRHEDTCNVSRDTHVFNHPSVLVNSQQLDELVEQRIAQEPPRVDEAALRERIHREVLNQFQEVDLPRFRNQITKEVRKQIRRETIIELHQNAYSVAILAVAKDLHLFRAYVAEHFNKKNPHRNILIGKISETMNKIKRETMDLAERLDQQRTVDEEIEEEKEAAPTTSVDVQVNAPSNGNAGNVEGSQNNTNNTTNNYNIQFPPPFPADKEPEVPHSYAAPSLCADKVRAVIEHYRELRHRGTFIRELTRAIYCYNRKNNAILYSSLCHNGYVYSGRESGVQFIKGPQLMEDIVRVFRRNIEGLEGNGDVSPSTARLALAVIEETPAATLAQDIAPVLHQASHGIFAELLDTWKLHFPEYVCHLNRLETAYSKAPHGTTPLMPTS